MSDNHRGVQISTEQKMLRFLEGRRRAWVKREARKEQEDRRYRLARAVLIWVCGIFWTLVCIAAATITACLTG